MEILLKTKQANNPAFGFLTPSDPIHGFYRHLVYMLKTKQYAPKSGESEESNKPSLVPYSSGRKKKYLSDYSMSSSLSLMYVSEYYNMYIVDVYCVL